MATDLSQYIDKVVQSIKREDAANLLYLFTLNPGSEQGNLRAHFPTPNDFDLYPLSEKFPEVVRAYLKMMKSIYIQNDIRASFADLNGMVKSLTRAAESQTNWVMPPLINSCTELINVYKVKAKNFPEVAERKFDEVEGDTNDSAQTSLELLAATINSLFKLCLTDKNLDLLQSKRIYIYFFLGQLMRIYFKLGKLELASSLEKALKGLRLEMPPLLSRGSSKRFSITYLYYSALLSLDASSFNESESKLCKIIEISSCYQDQKRIQNHLEKVYFLLLPLRLYNHLVVPSKEFWSRFPRLKYIYKEQLFDALLLGNTHKLQRVLLEFQVLFLKKHLLLLIEHLKSFCYLNLIKRTVKIVKQLNPEAHSHILPLNALQLSFAFVQNNNYTESGSLLYPLDSIECTLANLITEGRIKGYISHTNRCIVLSKTNPFPTK